MANMDAKVLKENVEMLVNQRNETKTKALINSGVGKDFFANLNKGQAPSIEKIISLADYLEVSIDDLLGRVKNIPSNIEIISDKKEIELIKAYRNKPDMQKSVDILLGITESPPQIVQQETFEVKEVARHGQIRNRTLTQADLDFLEANQLEDDYQV